MWCIGSMLLLGSRGTGFNSLHPDQILFFMAVIGYGIGDAFEIPVNSIEKDYQIFLVNDEKIGKAFRLIRDLLIFTTKRLMVVDKQGIGSKIEYKSIPYSSIVMYSMQTAGVMERESEIIIWMHGHDAPQKFIFRRGSDIQGVYNLISSHLLG
jgi:Bacterial PH domain